MTIERTDGEIIIRIPDSVEFSEIQRLIDFITYKEITKESKATQEDVDRLASEINKNWWEANKDRFLKNE
ncbi:hypothetical protein [Phaeodactylibacter luteus]|uniref:Uncharacterized protein n=1 Tax=Phaeodactylibacter luteus TaxID=1564516 RepID=A0A5C6RLY7_9BACT|nr:hypothetical protein [Phaeodactylibacter luteus]TXB62975.1 hypothetical protein FRY97_11585 [Phaeodactylibacter luteus]